jgi:hypothetical protein
MPQVYNLDEAFASEYSSRLYLTAQQKGNVLRPYMDFEPLNSAASLFYDTLSPSEAPTPGVTLHGDTPVVENNFGVRMLTPALWETGHLLDKDRYARLKINPQGSILSNDAEAFGRFVDSQIIAAALGIAYTGKNGTGPQVTLYQGSQGINGDGTTSAVGTLPAVATVAPMTLNKIRSMSLLCDRANMGGNRIWVVDPGDIIAMLGILQITNSDYNTVKALAQGEIDTFMGFKFVKLNGLPLDAATGTATRTFVFEANKALKMVELSKMTTDIAPDPTKRFNTRIYSKIDFGVGRTEEAIVHECLNTYAFTAATAIASQ